VAAAGARAGLGAVPSALTDLMIVGHTTAFVVVGTPPTKECGWSAHHHKRAAPQTLHPAGPAGGFREQPTPRPPKWAKAARLRGLPPGPAPGAAGEPQPHDDDQRHHGDPEDEMQRRDHDREEHERDDRRQHDHEQLSHTPTIYRVGRARAPQPRLSSLSQRGPSWGVVVTATTNEPGARVRARRRKALSLSAPWR